MDHKYEQRWIFHGIVFGKVKKTDQNGDILTFLKLKDYWDWIHNQAPAPKYVAPTKTPLIKVFP